MQKECKNSKNFRLRRAKITKVVKILIFDLGECFFKFLKSKKNTDPESVVRRAKLILDIVLYLKHDSKLFLLDGRIMLKKNATHIVELLMTRFS